MKIFAAKKHSQQPGRKPGWLAPVILVPLLFSGIIQALASSPAKPTPTTPGTSPSLQPDGDTTTLYLAIAVRQNVIDLSLDRIEITQTIQDQGNTVPLVANRTTALRAYARTNASSAIENAMLQIKASRDGQELANSPLLVGPVSIPTAYARSDGSTTINTYLPVEWLSSKVDLELQLDPGNLFDEQDETNNTILSSLAFTNTANLDVRIVPIAYTDYKYHNYPAPTSFNYIQNALLQLYPVSQVNLSTRSAYTYEGPLETSWGWSDLLLTIRSLRTSDQSPAGRIYFGLIPVETSSGYSWWPESQGDQGLGYVGQRAAIGLLTSTRYDIDGSFIVAHEIGHNLGRVHSPCGNPSGVGYYPYPGAAIGNFGLDITLAPLFTVTPETYKDIMGYCQPAWVSDYTYRIWFESQRSLAAMPAALPEQPVMLVRALIDPDGIVRMLPTYTFVSYPENLVQNGMYRIELLDANGAAIASHNISPLEYGDRDGSTLFAAIPLPSRPASQLRILKGETIIARQSLTTPGSLPDQASLISSPTGASLRWGAPETPAILRYTVGDGTELTTIALDWMGGEYSLDPLDFPSGMIHFEILLAGQHSPALNVDWDNSAAK